MSIRPIIIDKKFLQKECDLVTDINPDMIASLIHTAQHRKSHPIGCLGLAAPQIGYNKRVFVMWLDGAFIVVINPEIIKRSGEKQYKHESCLSVPGKSVRVRRYKRVRVSYVDHSGEIVERNFSNMNARVFQHELDHLNGVLI